MIKNLLLLLNLLNKKEKINLIFFTFLTLFLVLVESLSIGLIVPIISVIFDQTNEINLIISNFLNLEMESTELIKILILIFVLIYMVKSFYVFYYNWYLIKFSNKVQVRLSSDLLKNYLNLDYTSIIKRNSAELIRNIMAECGKINNILRNIIYLISEIFISLGIIALITLYNKEAAISAITVFLLSSIIYLLIFKNKVKKLGEEQVYLSEIILKSIIQKISSYKLINIIRKKTFFVNEFKSDLVKTTKNNLKVSLINILPRIWIEVFGIISLSIFILYLTSNNYSVEKIITTIGLLAFASLRIFPSMSKITLCLQSLKFVSATLEKVTEDINLDKVKKNNFDNLDLINFDKKIDIKNLDFSFKNNKKILDNTHLLIKKNESIFLKGESGSGKSTLANIISGLIKPDNCNISIDSRMYNLNEDEIRINCGFVHQETYLLDDTIKKNIAIGLHVEEINEKILDEVIKKARLENFIKSLPNGFNTIVGEKGSQISVGQAQRIGIARTLYHNPDLIIFDEATSALDNENAIQIIDMINEIKTNKAIIFISHDLNHQNKFDKTIEIINGKLFSV